MISPIRIAVFGGSFNPPTMGHAMVVQWLLWSGKVDRVLLVPSDGHPFGKSMLPLGDRASLLREMCSDIKLPEPEPVKRIYQLQVSLVESELPKPVYTYDLLTHLREKLPSPQFELFFVVGADILQETEKWHKWDQLREEFPLIVLGREGYPSPDGSPTIPGYSSTKVREMLQAGNPTWESQVTPGVRYRLQGFTSWPSA